MPDRSRPQAITGPTGQVQHITRVQVRVPLQGPTGRRHPRARHNTGVVLLPAAVTGAAAPGAAAAERHFQEAVQEALEAPEVQEAEVPDHLHQEEEGNAQLFNLENKLP